MSALFDNFSNSLSDLNTAFERFGADNPPPQKIDETIRSYLEEMRRHEKDQQSLLDKIRLGFADEIEKQVDTEIRNDLDNIIRSEVLKQVEEQVNAQIVEHIPVSLQQQAEETKEQLRDIKTSLANSEARITNSYIQSGDWDMPLAPILNSEGKKSNLYPSNLRSLFAYDLESAKTLNKDCGLVEAEELDMNLKQFLAHIGTRVEVVVQSKED
ncbi:hypothetical protein BYT27DRAFT_7191067 [Phlegmacium glaucopus]|nr:hypothetical protein BYT27DRAFT_7191067 [Phlegmacium glaucopus]